MKVKKKLLFHAPLKPRHNLDTPEPTTQRHGDDCRPNSSWYFLVFIIQWLGIFIS